MSALEFQKDLARILGDLNGTPVPGNVPMERGLGFVVFTFIQSKRRELQCMGYTDRVPGRTIEVLIFSPGQVTEVVLSAHIDTGLHPQGGWIADRQV